MAHTEAELLALARQSRIRAGQNPDGDECTDEEAIAFARSVVPHG
ncbi:MAG: hypothetical protein U0790_00200 [Isosphaeraceae bacterium]